ncbi:hypothetical protein BWI17_20855 [Betaproteobacteria bacterium GR16-43]|nr:hypothetical protein BWI17_20855 [Betaproteobacteria bacterium GR16-43]
MDTLLLQSFFSSALVAIAALIPITNPPGNAPIFLQFTEGLDEAERMSLAKRVAFNCFLLLLVSAFAGSYILQFFDISLPVVRVAGGLLVASMAWRLLTAEADDEAREDLPAGPVMRPANIGVRAFYPLAFPVTVGPGSISVAIALGASVQSSSRGSFIATTVGFVVGIAIVAVLIGLAFRYAARFVRLLGPNGTMVFLRLSAFILLCIGVQIGWDGVSELLAPWKAR